MEAARGSAVCCSSLCELCGGEAGLFCVADEAVLCWTCDAVVHGANFLVARHSRMLLCRGCGAHTAHLETGPRIRPPNSFPSCASCPSSCSQSDASLSATSSSSSSDTSDSRFCSRRNKQPEIRVSRGPQYTHSAACSSTPCTEDWDSRDSATSAPRSKRRV